MMKQVGLSIMLILPIPALSQVAPTAEGPTGDQTPMTPPPMVSGQALPTASGSATRSNYLDAGLAIESAYNDNLLPYDAPQPISGMSFSLKPTVGFDQSISRFHQTWKYSPGFTIYQHAGAQNEEDEDVTVAVQYRLSEHATLKGQDSFLKSSNVFNQGDALLGGSVSGSPSSSPADLLIPFINRLSNTVDIQITYQYSENGMLGGGGTTSLLDYPNQGQSTGLYNSNSRGGSAFYNRRLTSSQSIGMNYQYLDIVGTPVSGQVETQLNTLMCYYSLTLLHRLSLSLSAGPQHFNLTEAPLPAFGSWSPSVVASVGWQGGRGAIEGNYSQTTTTGGGLLGAYNSKGANASAHWRLSRTWTASSTANYAIYKNASILSAGPGGHSVSGTASLEHPFGEHLKAGLSYQRLHISYDGIASISEDPDSDRASISISYQFTRPLGR